MTEAHRSDPDPLESAVSEFRRMPVPGRPSDENLLARLATLRPTVGRTFPFHSHRQGDSL